MKKSVVVIGGGLAGCEAAHWLASKGIPVTLHEMRPEKKTEAHLTGNLAELVCSNSFKSLNPGTAPGILKQEMELLGSIAIACAKKASVSAGEALGVDRELFSEEMTKAIHSHPLITVERKEILEIPNNPEQLVIIASGPLTSESLGNSIRAVTGEESFYFYDSISPIIDASTINMEIAFEANRYGKKSRSVNEVATNEAEENADYINCPMSREEYEKFIGLLLSSERVQPKSFEKVKHYEGCMPIEEMADRGRDTLRFGPMKPVGLDDPRTGRYPHAVVQLRPENASRSAYNLVGFQTKLKYGEQAKVFRTIPGLENIEILRYGSMHRNSFVDSPRVLNLDLSLKNARHILLAGQITGVEGYMESAAIGIIAGIFAEARLAQKPIPSPPEASALGALLGHLRNPNPDFQPMGINFGLFEDSLYESELAPLRSKYPKKIPKHEKREWLGKISIKNAAAYAQRLQVQKL